MDVTDIDILLNETTQSPEAPQAPDLGIEPDALNEALSKFTDGALADYNSIPDLLSARSQNQELTKRITDFEAQSQISPFADPMVERINALAKDGASKEHILEFMKFQNIDVETLDGESAIKQQMRFQNPGLSSAHIDALYADKFPSLDEDDDASAKILQEARIVTESAKAKAYLAEQKVALNNTDSAQQREAMEKDVEVRTEQWGKYVKGYTEKVGSIKLELGDDKSGKLELDFQIPKDDKMNQQIIDGVVRQAVSEGLPLDGDGARVIQQKIEAVRRVVYADQLLMTATKDAYAAGVASKVRQYANPNPLPEGKNIKKTVKSQAKIESGFI
jgi:hypothetical protein